MSSEIIDKELRKGMYEADAGAVAYAVAEGADVNYKIEGNAETRLIHKAVENIEKDVPEQGLTNNMEVLKVFLTAPNLEINMQNASGNTAAHVAARLGNIEALKALEDAGIDLSIKNERGQTANDVWMLHTKGRQALDYSLAVFSNDEERLSKYDLTPSIQDFSHQNVAVKAPEGFVPVGQKGNHVEPSAEPKQTPPKFSDFAKEVEKTSMLDKIKNRLEKLSPSRMIEALKRKFEKGK